jgi:hypothetical protein
VIKEGKKHHERYISPLPHSLHHSISLIIVFFAQSSTMIPLRSMIVLID